VLEVDFLLKLDAFGHIPEAGLGLGGRGGPLEFVAVVLIDSLLELEADFLEAGGAASACQAGRARQELAPLLHPLALVLLHHQLQQLLADQRVLVGLAVLAGVLAAVLLAVLLQGLHAEPALVLLVPRRHVVAPHLPAERAASEVLALVAVGHPDVVAGGASRAVVRAVEVQLPLCGLCLLGVCLLVLQGTARAE
jgi:hypothetical protein